MSKRRPAPWVPLSVYYYDDPALIEAGELAEVMFTRLLAYAGRNRAWNGRLPRSVVLTRLGIAALENVPESAPESRLERLLEVGLVTAQGADIVLKSWLTWNESGERAEATRSADRERKTAATRGNASGAPVTEPEDVPEGAPESGTVSGAQDKIREDKKKTSSSGRSRATKQPAGWKPTEAHLKLARDLAVNTSGLVEQFTDHHAARGSKFIDWDAAFRTWIRNAAKYDTPKRDQPRASGAIDLSLYTEGPGAYKESLARVANQ